MSLFHSEGGDNSKTSVPESKLNSVCQIKQTLISKKNQRKKFSNHEYVDCLCGWSLNKKTNFKQTEAFVLD